MRYLILLALVLIKYCSFSPSSQEFEFANNEVVAHRGAWKDKGLPQNSIASLKHAIELRCTGSEFDVRMTADDVLIVTHDHDYNELVVEESTYEELAKHKLPNGEMLPTLEDYLKAGMSNNPATGLVCEIKPSGIKGRNSYITDKVLELVEEVKAEKYISSYISFSYEVVQRIEEINPSAKTMYLDGSKSPESLSNDGINGLDYHYSKFKQKPEWITNARLKNLDLNAWTVNKIEDIDWLLANDFDYITTDEPELVFERRQESPTSANWKLIWADEFNYKGKPDSTKWKHEIGFKRNKELQYYTNQPENSRVEDGTLIIEAHKEIIKNEAFISESDKSWKKNRPHSDYSSASLTTKDLAEWQYGRIDIRAKLPKGRGMWPAFWMLGKNCPEVGWPACGEIDIMEHVGYNPDSIFGTIHTKAYNHLKNTQKGKSIFIENPYDTFHDYSVIWTAESIDFLVNGKVYNHIENEHKTTDEWPFDQHFHLKVNVAVGGMWGGVKGIDENIFPNQMIIDYVRVFKKN
ncbi:family 16 glycosylhydrolase [Portibacter lacus]|uniref:Licheninase n=1 Tax=Portibacter lacus TaxID=1099794 RepID=A0AA37SK06_9BACT|nr:family 16 glycosylhydrolase [Portibacter lacus]GLR15392.1 hypothetical protein GCM10007940_00070 [Portibacter lacus]